MCLRVPALSWLRDYKTLHNDIVAGLTVGIVLVPQSMAYAALAELPPVYGLYTSLAPLPIYAIFGTSRHLSVGPFALTSLLIADCVSVVVPPDVGPDPGPRYVAAVLVLTLIVGIIHLLMAALRLDRLISFCSDSALEGFNSAAAILIAASQIKHLLGMSIPPSTLLPKLWMIGHRLDEVNPAAMATGLSGVALLFLVNRWNKQCCARVPIPEQLLLVVLATVGQSMLALDVPVVGKVPDGIPTLHLPMFRLIFSPSTSMLDWPTLLTLLQVRWLLIASDCFWWLLMASGGF